MKSKNIFIPHPKIRCEWVELRFMQRAIELRFRVSRPWGDSAPYDAVTEFRRRFRRVQVKCTSYRRGNSFKCHLDSNGSPYSPAARRGSPRRRNENRRRVSTTSPAAPLWRPLLNR